MPNVNTYNKDKYIPCKYYRKESAIEIKCLGLCGSHTCNVFPTKEEKKAWKSDFCRDLYWNCPLYIALDIDHGETD